MNLGRYEVVRELGKGAMGIVYLAKDPLIGRLVALKTIRVAHGADDEETKEFQQRFVREAQAAGVLSHPSIVTVHDIGQSEENGFSFIAMEYVEGRNLKEVLHAGEKMSFSEICEILAQVAEAIDYAHSKGIVHRDVKPANIILCGESRAKITDFGIAKIASSVQNLTTTGQFLGTPNYMAPEQVKGLPVDGRTDIFSLGIVLYESLTRRKPFGGDSLTSISYKIVHEPFQSLYEIDPTIPDGFDQIVIKCLAKDPAHRYQRAKDLAADLRAVNVHKLRDDNSDVISDSTMVLGDKSERKPTVEVPFPDALNDSQQATRVGADQLQASPKGLSMLGRRAAALRHVTLPGVKLAAREAGKKKLHPAIFLSIVGLCILGLILSIGSIWRQRVDVPPVDANREALVAKQRDLRLQGGAHLRSGNVEAAYSAFQQLHKMAPKSPAVLDTLRRLEFYRFQQLGQKQRVTQAQAKLDEGKKLYEARDFTKAITAFEEAFHLNPNSDEAVNYLKMAREQMALKQQIQTMQRATNESPTGGTRIGVAPGSNATTGNSSSALMTVFNSPVSDGYIQVRVAGQTVLHENLWEERRGFRRRKSPRNLSIVKAVRPQTGEVEVWIVIPSLKMQEHRTFRHPFRSGIVHRLIVSLDPATKKIDLQIF